VEAVGSEKEGKEAINAAFVRKGKLIIASDTNQASSLGNQSRVGVGIFCKELTNDQSPARRMKRMNENHKRTSDETEQLNAFT
jgi:hypothetical protein